MFGIKGFADQFVFVSRDIRASTGAQIENPRDMCSWLWAIQIADNQTTNVLGKGYTEFTRTLLGLTLRFLLQCYLRSRHHDGTIITSLKN